MILFYNNSNQNILCYYHIKKLCRQEFVYYLFTFCLYSNENSTIHKK